MGMFDELRCHYPLPIEGANARLYQTKDTERQWLGQYEIREDGTLWVEEYDEEDRSDPSAEGLAGLAGMWTKVNRRWVPANESGAIHFYDFDDKATDKGWIEWMGLFDEGKLVKPPTLVHYEPADGVAKTEGA